VEATVGAVAPLLPGPGGFILIGVGAFSLPLLARRIGVPAVVLEILYGLVLGPEILDWISAASSDARFIEILAELGLFLLMFLAGFEIDFERLERQGPGPVLTGLVMFGLILIAAWIGFGLLDPESTDQRIFLTLLTSAASLGIIIPALRATGRSRSRLGQLTLVIGVEAEFLSAAAIVAFGVWYQEGFGLGLLAVPALFGIMVVALFALRRLSWWYPERFERLFASHDPDELGIRATLALLFVFVGITEALHIEPILGAFMAGALFAYVFRETGQLEARLGGIAYGFFIPVFFINVGVNFPLGELQDGSVLGKALALIAIAIVIKLIPALILVFRGLTLRESLASGVLLAGQLSVIIALAEFGVQIGVIDEGLEAGAILLVGVTAILSPVVFRLLAPPLSSGEDESTPADLAD
jgi:Kef-type K+ transport system membrane component KefB